MMAAGVGAIFPHGRATHILVDDPTSMQEQAALTELSGLYKNKKIKKKRKMGVVVYTQEVEASLV